MSDIRKVIVMATPTSPLLSSVIHELYQKPNLETTILTRETSISLPSHSSHSHGFDHDHNHHHTNSKISHIRINFEPSSLNQHIQGKDAVICILNGSDLHLSPMIIDAALSSSIKLFIPSEFGLDSSNPKIRELLPPYQTRYEVQEQLRKSGMKWKAIYSGIMLEDGLKTDGVLGIDVLWGSAVVFPGAEGLRVAVSTYGDVAKEIVSSLERAGVDEKSEVYCSSFTASLDELITVIEKRQDKKFDRYEGILEGARKEAKERMKMGYFDGGVALMGRVAVWDSDMKAWDKWTENGNAKGWKEIVGKMADAVRNGDIGGGGCAC